MVYISLGNDGRGGVVGIATRYGLGGPRIESQWRRGFLCPPARPRVPGGLLCSRPLLGVKWPERGAVNGLELCLRLPSVPAWAGYYRVQEIFMRPSLERCRHLVCCL